MADSDSYKGLEDYFDSLLNEDALEPDADSERIEQTIAEQKVVHAGERKQVNRSVESASSPQPNKPSDKHKKRPNNVTDLRDHVSNNVSNAKDIAHEVVQAPQEKLLQRVSPVEPPAPKNPESLASKETEKAPEKQELEVDRAGIEVNDSKKEHKTEESKPENAVSPKSPAETEQVSDHHTDKVDKNIAHESTAEVKGSNAPAETIYERPHAPSLPEPSMPSAKVQEQSHEEKLYQEQKVLEAEKREKLQRLLSAQLTKTETKPKPEVKKELTAQEKLEILAEQEKAALFRAKLDGKEAADTTKQLVEETLRTTAEALSQKETPTVGKANSETEALAPPQTDVISESENLTDDHVKITEELLEWGDSGRPHWAEHPFEVLLFEVSGLSLAVPLVALGQIVPMSDKLTKLQGQSEWFMGILPSPVGDVRTINTAMFVMPERYDPAQVNNFKYVVTIDGLPWGLAVDQVNQPITLNPDDVKWRGERTKRPWLAGTVKSHMCALLDIPQMAHILENMSRN